MVCAQEYSVLQKHYKSQYLTLNVHCWNKSVAFDMVFSNTLAIWSGETYAQELFICMESVATNVKGLPKADKHFVNTLEDTIHHGGTTPTRKPVSNCKHWSFQQIWCVLQPMEILPPDAPM